MAYGGQKWGNFIAVSGLNSGRFLDPPELHAIHDKGNEENLFDRIDFQPSGPDTIHVNLGYSRSWFQTPNSYDNLNAGLTDPLTKGPLGPTDQRSQIQTYNIAPVWTHLFNSTTLFTFGGFVRHDQYNYYPSAEVFADGTGLTPGGSSETINQSRTLTNAGLRSDVSYVKGIHNVKAGVTFEQTSWSVPFFRRRSTRTRAFFSRGKEVLRTGQAMRLAELLSHARIRAMRSSTIPRSWAAPCQLQSLPIPIIPEAQSLPQSLDPDFTPPIEP